MNKQWIKDRYNGINGYTYSGYWDNVYHFSKRVEPPKSGYFCIKCTEKDLIDQNIIDMLKLEVTK